MLTEKQAYASMILFLERYMRNTKRGEVGALISGMRLATGENGAFETFDPGYWGEWMEDVQQVLKASETPEDWEAFEDEHLVWKATAPDGTELRARLGDSSKD